MVEAEGFINTAARCSLERLWGSRQVRRHHLEGCRNFEESLLVVQDFCVTSPWVLLLVRSSPVSWFFRAGGAPAEAAGSTGAWKSAEENCHQCKATLVLRGVHVKHCVCKVRNKRWLRLTWVEFDAKWGAGGALTPTDSLYSQKFLFNDRETVKSDVFLVPNKDFLKNVWNDKTNVFDRTTHEDKLW